VPANHAKQKKALKHKKKREAKSLKLKETTHLSLRPSVGELLRAAAGRPLGPAYVSDDWDEDSPLPTLVSVVVTRKVPGQLFVGALALLDRTCLGVKNAILFPPQTELELEQRIQRMGETIGTLRRVEPLIAQSAVYHGIEYARALGFAPHPDFPEAIFGPRPPVLVDTPLSRRERPYYISGPDDDTVRVRLKLTAARGSEGFDVMAGAPLGDAGFGGLLDELDEEDEEDDEEDGSTALPP
jgi:hypothetical protein